VPTNVPTNIPVNLNIPTDVPTNIPVNLNIPTDVPTNIPVNLNIPTNIPTNVPTNTPTTITTPVNVVVPSIWLPPFVPLPKLGGGSFGMKQLIKGMQKTKYMPSLAASVFNIRGKQPGIFSGLEVRPLPGSSGKRKSSSSKLKMPNIKMGKMMKGKRIKF
jgi:hypothetical protein